ncbi:MAG: MFS transporter [Rhodanobacter sp.]
MPTGPHKASIGERLDALHWNRFHTVALLVLGVGWGFDALEVTLISSVLGVLQIQWHLDAMQMSWIFGVWFLGLMLGAFAFGRVADRFGRKPVFLGSLLIYGLFTALTAIAPSYGWLLALRLLTAIGVGAEYAAINATISELIPALVRGRAGALVMNFWSIGAMLAALLSIVLLAVLPPQYAWRAVFGFGAVIALMTVALRRLLPESPRWLESQGQADAAARIVDRIAQGQTRFPNNHQRKDFAHTQATAPAGLRTLWRQYPHRLVLGCTLDFAEAAGYYGLFAFLPLVVLPALMLRVDALPWFYLVGNLGALIGGLVVAWLLESWGRKPTVTTCYGLTALAMLGLASVSGWGESWIFAGFVVANLLATASWVGAYPMFTELFPTALRSTGVGTSIAVGRLGALASPFLVALVGARYGVAAVAFLLAGFWLIGFAAMLVWSWYGVEARGRSLDSIAPDNRVLFPQHSVRTRSHFDSDISVALVATRRASPEQTPTTRATIAIDA